MTTTTPVGRRRGTQTAAYRLAAMLIGTGTTHFLVPKPFDTIVPAELPGVPGPTRMHRAMVRQWWPKSWPMRIVALAGLPLQVR